MFQIASDLHIEQFFVNYIKATAIPSYKEFCDIISKVLIPQDDSILLIAGDICSVVDYYPFLKLFIQYCSDNWKRVIWIAGNHEYYNKLNKHMDEVNFICSYISNKFNNVEYLNNNFVQIEDHIIWGGTLWSWLPANINIDFPIYIQDITTRKMTRDDYNICFKDAFDSLKVASKFAQRNGKKLIVLSHHAPIFFHMSDDWLKSDKRYLYATELSAECRYPIDTWICGHTHVNIDFQKLGWCRIISNSDPTKTDYKPTFVF